MSRPVVALVALSALLPSTVAGTLSVRQDHATVQDALDAASSGHTLRVAAGTDPPFTVDSQRANTFSENTFETVESD